MLRWKEIKEAIEGSPLAKVTDDTRLTYVVVHGPHVGFGVVPQGGTIGYCDVMKGEWKTPSGAAVSQA